jgi:hypothetical protein
MEDTWFNFEAYIMFAGYFGIRAALLGFIQLELISHIIGSAASAAFWCSLEQQLHGRILCHLVQGW